MTERTPSSTLRPDEVEAMLTMATTGEAGKSGRPAIDLSQLTVHEIFSAIHVVTEADDRMPTRPDDPRQAEVDGRDRRLAAHDAELVEALERLPNSDPEKTRDVFTLLAGSGSVTDRRFAGFYIGILTRADHDYGLELWGRLLEDDHAEVADAAWTPIDSRLEDGFYGSDEILREDGITRDDLLSLTSDYVRHLTHLRRDAEGLPWDGSGRG